MNFMNTAPDVCVDGEIFNPLEPFSFYLTIEEWMQLKPRECVHYSDGRRGLQPGWTEIFETKLREVNPSCIRWYTGSAKKASSRKHMAAYFTGRAACKNPECSLSYRLVIEKEPTASTKEVEVQVTPQGMFSPSDPIEVQNRSFNRFSKKREMVGKLADEIIPVNGQTFVNGFPSSHSFTTSPIAATADFPNTITKRYPPFVRYGKRHVGGSSNVLVGCGSGKTMEDLLYCATLEADKAKLISEKDKLDAETVMLRAKTDELIAKKAKLETETNNLIMHRLKLKHELNSIGLDVEIVTVSEDNQLRQVMESEDR